MENIQLTALLPDQMMVAQEQLIEWCQRKIFSIEAEVTELKESIEHATASKWSTRTLKNQQAKAEKRMLFFDKMKEALKAGYYIVPNFPVDLFAIRTNREDPLQKGSTFFSDNKRQDAQELPVGEGEYKNPFPIVVTESEQVGDKMKHYSYAEAWNDLEFPVTMLKPEIIQATNRAMALEIFDQFGVLPQTRKEDPIIVGQIINKSGYNSKTISFMIAWHFDTKIF